MFSRRVLLFAHLRSGSSSLYQILELHPDLHILEEPFSEGFVRWNPANINYLERIHDIPSLDVQLAEIFASYNGLKVLNYQLPEALSVHLLQRPDITVIFLRRRNLLQSIVSVLIAQQTTLWKKWDMTKPLEEYYRNLQPLDIDDIQQRITDMNAQLDFFESVIDSRAEQEVIKLTYEGLYFAPKDERNEQIASIWRMLGIHALASEEIQYYLQPESVKMNSAETYQLLPNAQEIEQACGSDETGWLFR